MVVSTVNTMLLDQEVRNEYERKFRKHFSPSNNHTCGKVKREYKIDLPIHAKYFRSGGANDERHMREAPRT